MKKASIETEGEAQQPSSKIKSYSVAQILAAGGATAFATQKGSSIKNIVSHLSSVSKDSFLTEDEAMLALEILRNSK